LPQPELQAEFEEMFKQMGAEMGAEMETEEQPEPQSNSKEKTKGTPATAAATSATAAPTTAPTTATASVPPSVPPSASASASASAAQPTGGKSGAAFQDTIRRTMERMQSSGEQATAAAASGGDDDFLTEMLKQLTAGDFAGGSEEDFSKMLMGMMEQLTNKEILYEPMKELHDKFPVWLAKNKDATPAEDLKRYMEQKTIVSEIVAKFNEPTYSDSNAADREYIVDRMQKVNFGLSQVFLFVIQRLTSLRCKRRDRRRPTWWGIWHLPKKRSIIRTTSALRNKSLTSSHGAPIYTRTLIYIPIVCDLYASTFHPIPVYQSNANVKDSSESPEVPNSLSPIDKRLDHSNITNTMTLI
jgi:hypothetical protein